MKKLIQINIMLVFFFGLNCQSEKQDHSSSSFFQKLKSTETGLDFKNTIEERAQFNHFFYNYIYNGGGVAIGDINNDGLPDLFCSGNQVSDKLYLNKGNLEFEDITTKAGIIQDQFWSTGVTMADVNGDGWLDIYLCRGGPFLKPGERSNLLYINNQDGSFTEQAQQFGLASQAYSTQAVFFDMDNDGDLDMYLANTPADIQQVLGLGLPQNTINLFESDRLYRNNGKHRFADISVAAGIANYAYALNVVASDVNDDGWVDLLVTNDFDAPDFYYVNQGNLSFKNEAPSKLKHMSLNSMGSDIADINNDGFEDLIVLDMAAEDHIRSKTNMESMSSETFWKNVQTGKHFQYMFNTLQLNNGNGHFSEIGQLAGIAKTDWSWGAIAADFDNDGWKDILVTNGIKKDMRNNDILTSVRQTIANRKEQIDWLKTVEQTPSVPLANYLFKNNGDFSFSNVAEEWGMNQTSFSNGLAVADLDRDGDLDIVMNNIDAELGVYENKKANTQNYIRLKLESTSANRFALNAKVKIFYDGKIQQQELSPTRGYLSASETIVHFGLGQQSSIDSILIQWSKNKTSIHKGLAINRQHVIREMESRFVQVKAEQESAVLFEEVTNRLALNYKHQENEFDDFKREILLPHKQSQNGPYISSGDVNGDGLDDFYVGGAATYEGVLFLQKQTGQFEKRKNLAFELDKDKEDLGALFFDADQDGDLDLYVASGGSEFPPNDFRYQDRLYLNKGNGDFVKIETALPKKLESTQVVKASDVDQDGDLDLFVGGRLIPGAYPSPANSYLLLNENGSFKNATVSHAPKLSRLGMVTDAVFADYDGDDDDDLILVGEWMNVEVFENEAGRFRLRTDSLGLADSRSWWWSIAAADLDKDGDLDFVVGNLGKNTKFKASSTKPFFIFGNDFDQNGTNDIVLANYYKEELVPIRGRECSSEQMPFIEKKFPSYQAFAKANMEEIYSKEKLEQALRYEIQNFETSILWNENGKFSREALPMEAQFFPMRDLLLEDFNQDGHVDILAVGNLYATEVETMRYDAGVGLFLKGDGKGKFQKAPNMIHQFFTPHDARSLSIVNGEQTYILVGNNQEKIQCFVWKK